MLEADNFKPGGVCKRRNPRRCSRSSRGGLRSNAAISKAKVHTPAAEKASRRRCNPTRGCRAQQTGPGVAQFVGTRSSRLKVAVNCPSTSLSVLDRHKTPTNQEFEDEWTREAMDWDNNSESMLADCASKMSENHDIVDSQDAFTVSAHPAVRECASVRQQPQQGIFVLSPDLLLRVGLGGKEAIALPLDKHSKMMLGFLSCCRTFRTISLPVTMCQPQYHLRDLQHSRFAIVEANIAGDAICDSDLTQLMSVCCMLRSLTLSMTRSITSVMPLTAMHSLENLVLQECHKLRDLSPLASCPRLRSLQITSCANIHNLSPLQNCQQLANLVLQDNPYLPNIKGLGKCRKLQRLSVRACHQVTDISELAQCKTLVQLEFTEGRAQAVVWSCPQMSTTLQQRVKMGYLTAGGAFADTDSSIEAC